MTDRLKGKVAVVTGAAPRGEGVGNGMATAILFAREGGDDALATDAQELVARFRRHFPRRAAKRSWLSFGHISLGL